jgi:hypothetical protein
VTSARLLLLGEGPRDVGQLDPSVKRHPPCDFEGDLPRLVRRISEHAGGLTRFGYDAETLRGITARIPLAGRPTRTGGKSKELRNAVLAALRSYSTIIALIDARAEEVLTLQQDIRDILEQCHERSSTARVAIGLAIHEIEIWMLADRESRNAAFGATIGAQPMPGDLEGVRDPKVLWSERAGQSPPPDGGAFELHGDRQRSAAWQALRPQVVAHQCPRGFAPFMKDVLGALPWRCA